MTEDAKNFGELIKKWSIDNDNILETSSAEKTVKKDIRMLLERFSSEEKLKIKEVEKRGTSFSGYSIEECEIYMYAYVMGRLDELGRGIMYIKPKVESTKSGQGGRHMGTGTDELCIEK